MVNYVQIWAFWICSTLIFVAASFETFFTCIAHKWKKEERNYDIDLVTWSAGVFYGYVTIVPLCLCVILNYFSAPSGLVQLFCLYGYSLFVFSFGPLCCAFGNFQMGDRWSSRIHVSGFVALNLEVHTHSAGERWLLIVASIFLLQLALAVVLKLYLFTDTV